MGETPARIPGGPIRVPWVSSGLFLLTLLCWYGGVGDWFQYHAEAIERGEYWRVLTGHFTHLTSDHLFWDGLVFLSLGISLELRDRRVLIGAVLASGLLIGLTLPLFEPGLIVYRGLSGIDTALFVLLIAILAGEAYRSDRFIVLALAQAGLAGLVSKVVFEYLTGQALFVGHGLTPVPGAHIVGGAAGLAVAIGQFAPSAFVQE